MRRILILLVLLVAAVVVIALVAPNLIPESMYRNRAEDAASDQLDRRVTLGGPVSLAFLPRVEVRAQNVSIANAEGFGDEPLAEMAEMRVAVAFWPLIASGFTRFEMEEFLLVDPVIRLSQRGGVNNWTLGRSTETPAPAPAETGFRRPGALPVDASFGDIRIQNGRIEYSADGEAHRIEGLNLHLDMPTVDDPARLVGQFSANGEPMTFDLRLGALRQFFEGRETSLALTLGGRLIDLRFTGRFLESDNLVFDGDLNAAVPSLRALAAFAGSPLPEGDNFRRFEARGALAGSPDRLALTNATILLDAIRGTGALAVRLGGDRPSVTGQLDLASLDVNPYFAPAPAGAASQGLQPWSRDAIDLAPLGLVDADITATAARLLFQDIEITDVALHLQLQNSRLQADLQRFALYGGTGAARAVANARTAVPTWGLTANLSGLNALPFLEAAAGFDRLSGVGELVLDITTSGASHDAIMRALAGTGRFAFRDGAIRGVNLAQAIRTVQGAITSGSLPQGFGEQESTDFSSLAGTAAIAGGVATNTDLLMLSPLLRVDGNGRIDLGAQMLDYNLSPRAVASLQGQDGERDLQGLVVPIRIQGSFANPSVRIDFETVARNLIQTGIRGALTGQSPEDAIRNALRGALGLGGSPAEGETSPEGEGEGEQEEEVDPTELLLRGLLGRARRQQEPPAEPEPEPEPEEGDGG